MWTGRSVEISCVSILKARNIENYKIEREKSKANSVQGEKSVAIKIVTPPKSLKTQKSKYRRSVQTLFHFVPSRKKSLEISFQNFFQKKKNRKNQYSKKK